MTPPGHLEEMETRQSIPAYSDPPPSYQLEGIPICKNKPTAPATVTATQDTVPTMTNVREDKNKKQSHQHDKGPDSSDFNTSHMCTHNTDGLASD